MLRYGMLGSAATHPFFDAPVLRAPAHLVLGVDLGHAVVEELLVEKWHARLHAPRRRRLVGAQAVELVEALLHHRKRENVCGSEREKVREIEIEIERGREREKRERDRDREREREREERER